MQLLLEPSFGFLFLGGLIGGIIALATTIFWLWMLIDAITNAALTGTEKIIWCSSCSFCISCAPCCTSSWRAAVG